jgi:hypothetical protein
MDQLIEEILLPMPADYKNNNGLTFEAYSGSPQRCFANLHRKIQWKGEKINKNKNK